VQDEAIDACGMRPSHRRNAHRRAWRAASDFREVEVTGRHGGVIEGMRELRYEFYGAQPTGGNANAHRPAGESGRLSHSCQCGLAAMSDAKSR